MAIFSFTLCVEVAQLLSGFLLEGIALGITVNLVCLREEGSSGAFVSQSCLPSLDDFYFDWRLCQFTWLTGINMWELPKEAESNKISQIALFFWFLC